MLSSWLAQRVLGRRGGVRVDLGKGGKISGTGPGSGEEADILCLTYISVPMLLAVSVTGKQIWVSEGGRA